MKKHLLTLMAIALIIAIPSQAKVTHLLPKPKSVTQTEGSFALNREIKISDPTECKYLLNFLNEHGCTQSQDAKASVTVTMVNNIDGAYDYKLEGYENEAYTLDITPDEIKITAITAVGVIRAAQTLTQLAEGYEGAASLELVSITDWPSFKLRGYMHDVGRSYVEFETLKEQIRLMSRFKINTFHWHLTENQAWRFEVKQYPQLTSKESMTRFEGKYYTQEQCKALQEYALEHGVIIIPEIDMPGHSEAFVRAMKYDMQSEQGVKALQNILDEVAAVFDKSPYIHIGADEKTITYNNFLKIMTDKIHSLGKMAVCWNPISGVTITAESGFDMTQMWSTAGTKISGIPNIDCRYNYTNHFDVFADLIGIYKSNIYYEQQGSPEVAGTISAPWNDRKTATEKDIYAQNNIYANTLASAERAWIGGGKQYIEKGGTMLPNGGEEYYDFVDFERRLLFHKANSLKNVPIPYVKQTNVRWRITEAYPNNGDMNAVFAPEEEDGDMKESYTHNGITYNSSVATGAGIYLRHTWGTIIPTFYSNPQINTTAYAWTYVYSDTRQELGALIEFQNYSRSEKDLAPDEGKWDRKGSRIWLNGTEILPPTWDNTGVNINNNEQELKNENFTARKPVAVTLEEGWNKVFIKLPYVEANRVRLNKWMFTFVLTDPDGNKAAEGIIYSPNKRKDEGGEIAYARISEIQRDRDSRIGTAPGFYPAETAKELDATIEKIKNTLSQEMSPEEREQQINELEEAYNKFLANCETRGIILPKNDVIYRIYTPERENRYPTPASKGDNKFIVGKLPAETTDASQWEFVKREDGKYNILNSSHGTYISPEAVYNAGFKTSVSEPAKGWEVLPTDIPGQVIIVCDEAQFNQTTRDLGYRIFNWGYNSTGYPNSYNISDAGCKYMFEVFQDNSIGDMSYNVDGNNAIYDLKGYKDEGETKGIYIINGKKRLVK
ncbi:MAG: family 20 glycosylhydrolase [Bacteroidaceae bacterium]|nr:family 20 glycosylhydrolase [Bacteroidaceae bacterium]